MSTLPAIPPILDQDRQTFVAVVSSTTVISVPFPVFGGQEDLNVFINGQMLSPSLWTFTSASGTPLSLLPLPITDGEVTLNNAVTSGFVQVIGNWQGRQVIQPTAPGISRREFNQTISTLIAAVREIERLARLNLQFIQTDTAGDGYLSALNLVIANVANPVNLQDAVNLQTVTQLVSEAAQQASSISLLIAGLPTTLPAASGVLWNNGGYLCVS